MKEFLFGSVRLSKHLTPKLCIMNRALPQASALMPTYVLRSNPPGAALMEHTHKKPQNDSGAWYSHPDNGVIR